MIANMLIEQSPGGTAKDMQGEVMQSFLIAPGVACVVVTLKTVTIVAFTMTSTFTC